MKKRLTDILIVLAILSVGFCILLFSYEESEQFEGFPVPKSAELTSNQKNLEQYEWGPASEENGLPLRYRAIIRLWGWEKKGQEGALSFYEKDGKVIGLISQTDYLGLSISEE